MPQLISLVIETNYRNQGAGTYLIPAVEKEVKSRPCTCLHLSVNQEENLGALRLYQRLGFVIISLEPRRSVYTNTDADGVTTEVTEWLIDMVKQFAD